MYWQGRLFLALLAILQRKKDHQSIQPSHPTPMPMVSRICLRCRMQILSNGSSLPSLFVPQSRATTQLALSRALRFRVQLLQSKFLSTKTPHTPDDLATPPERPAKAKNEFDAMADPVLVKLTGVAKPLVETPPRRVPRVLPIVDVDEFLAGAKRSAVRKKTPSDADPHMIDETYGELLSASGPTRNRQNVIGAPPPLEELERKCCVSRKPGDWVRVVV